MQLEMHTWKIEGLRPLLQHNPVNSLERATSSATATAAKSAKILSAADEAARGLYVTGGHFWHPSEAVMAGLVAAASKRKVGKMSAVSFVTGCISIPEREMWLLNPKTMKPLTDKEWIVDERRVVIKNRGAILRARPMWKNWACLVTLEVDMEWVSDLKVITDLLNVTGQFIGLGDGRPDPTKGKKCVLGFGRYYAELKN